MVFGDPAMGFTPIGILIPVGIYSKVAGQIDGDKGVELCKWYEILASLQVNTKPPANPRCRSGAAGFPLKGGRNGQSEDVQGQSHRFDCANNCVR